jgi:hypothetical protein
MALSALNWRYVGSISFVSGIAAAHDALHGLGQNTQYADGTTRTPGSGSAWTWAREQSGGTTVAVYGTPPINALNMQYILGGTSGASSYTFLTPDTATLANCIVYGMNRASGAFTTWTSSTPFTTASSFSGYWRGTRAFSVAYDSVALWESQEGCLIQWGVSGTNVTSSVAFGALLDPLSTASANAETDGRVYVMAGSGSLGNTAATWASTAGDGSFWGNGGASTGATHSGMFAPGTNVMVGGAGAQTSRFGNFTPSATFTSVNGDIARVPLCATSTAGNFLGQFRQVYIIRDAQTRLVYQNGATALGYVWGSTLGTNTDAVVLSY